MNTELNMDRPRGRIVERELEDRMKGTEVRVLSWCRGSNRDVQSGLLGWIRIAYGAIEVDNITLRWTSDGRYVLAFPTRTAKNGAKHAIVRPIDDAARRAIEHEILAQLGQRPDAAVAPEGKP